MLVVQAIEDPISAHRIERLAASPRARQYDFEHTYAMSTPSAYENLDGMEARVADAIEAFRPDLVLVHVGMAHRRDPDRFEEAIIGLARRFPSLRLAVDDPYVLLGGRPRFGADVVFDRSDEVQDIVALVF